MYLDLSPIYMKNNELPQNNSTYSTCKCKHISLLLIIHFI